MKYYRKYIIAAILIISVLAVFFYGLRIYLVKSAHDYEDVTDLTLLYEAEDEIAEASNRLKEIRTKNEDPAEVIVANDNSQQISIIFEGLPDQTTTAKIVDVLKKHNVPATFFVEGQNAGDFPETIKLLDGYTIGNTTYVGLAHLERLPEEELLHQVVRGQKLLNKCFTMPVVYFHGITTKYSKPFLEVVKASNLPYAVKETTRYQFHLTKLNTALDVSNYHGIVSIPIGKIVEIIERTPGEIDERPENDKQPTIVDKVKPVSDKLTLAEELDIFLTECKKANKQIVPLTDMKKIKFIPGDSNIENNMEVNK
jgi:peptidoglycan/xylan/chitin deacetylase (PgdA/CDA1 family)